MRAAQIDTDGITVWVNSNIDGSCIARFGRQGIDIHLSFTEQRRRVPPVHSRRDDSPGLGDVQGRDAQALQDRRVGSVQAEEISSFVNKGQRPSVSVP